MRSWLRRTTPCVVATGALLGVLPAAAQTPTPTEAPEPTGITLTPKPGSPFTSRSGTHFELGEVAPGEPRRGTLVARNLGGSTETAVLYGADAIPARGGGFGFTTRDDPPTDVGAWIRLDRSTVTLAGRQETTLGFELVVPERAAAGEHVGGIVLEPDRPTSGGAVEIGTRIAVGVYLTVSGGSTAPLRPELTVTKVSAPLRGRRICPSVSYSNTGTAVLDPAAEIVVDPALPGATRRLPAGKVGGVAPGGSVDVDLPCVTKAPLGRSRVTVRLLYPGGTAERGADVGYWPFTVVAAASLLLLLLLALLWLLLLAKRRERERDDDAATAAEQTTA